MQEERQKADEQHRVQIEEQERRIREMKEEQDTLMRETQRDLQDKLKQQEEMLKKGAQEQADKMQREIDNLREQQRNAAKGGDGPFSFLGKVFDTVISLPFKALTLPFKK